MRSTVLISSVFIVGGFLGWVGSTMLGRPTLAQQPEAAPSSTAEDGIKAATAEYVKAFNAGDAKAAAALWTTAGEYIDVEGVATTGRDEIEKSLAEFFKANPKLTVEVRVENVRIRGRGLASAEGVVLIKRPGQETPSQSRYTALHVLEDGKWRAASISEYVPDPALSVTPKQLEWLIGEWSAKGDAGTEVKIVYAWDEDKVFINGSYRILKDGKLISKGTQVLGQNPTGGLRSWMFDSSGTTSDAIWMKDDSRWISESIGLLPDGTEVFSVNVLIPLGKDAFTWQTTEREINGSPTSGLAPIKVTRVQK
jgi:uncharacterized protein (TIGR02246 family)